MLISIIIPFYDKDHNHITNMLNYLSKLSFNKEVIFIDDRNDKSLDIRNMYNIPNEYKIIPSFSNGENVGTFESRRTGVLNATGDYIWFVDVDDMPLEFKNLPFDNEDLVIYDFIHKNDAKDVKYDLCPVTASTPIHYFKNFKIQKYLLKYISLISKFALWNKLIKRTLLLDIFNEISLLKNFTLREDSYLLYEILKRCSSIKLKNSFIYCYVNPYEHDKFLNNLKKENKLLDHLKECIPDNTLDKNEFIEFYISLGS